MMLFDGIVFVEKQGYIAGTADGVLTVGGNLATRDIVVLNAQDLSVVQYSQSLSNGHYLLNNLNPAKQYLIMARDYNREYEPAVFDYVTPATDLTVKQQQELWESWQTK